MNPTAGRRINPAALYMTTDFRFALRQLLKSPGFTLLALLTLTLGIGLNPAIFSLINDLFLRGLPFREPARVLHVFSHFKEQTVGFPLSAPRYIHFREGQTIFDGFAAENGLAATMPMISTGTLRLVTSEVFPIELRDHADNRVRHAIGT